MPVTTRRVEYFHLVYRSKLDKTAELRARRKSRLVVALIQNIPRGLILFSRKTALGGALPALSHLNGVFVSGVICDGPDLTMTNQQSLELYE
ncbi:hypothetical protein J6590_069772 [Homalodisca vitripennis]|nr:hypothetical protein J6590_069772 [Homalodisca vitripennis]